MKKFMFIVSFCLALPNLTYGFGLFSKDEKEPDYSVPQNTEVIMHFTNLPWRPGYLESLLFSSPDISQVFYYDANANIIGSWQNDVQLFNDIFVEGKNKIAYLLTNNNILADNEGFKKYNINIEQSYDPENPSETGYLEDKQIFYSLADVSYVGHPTYMLNFISDTQNYTVIMPYRVQSVCYDNTTEKFICSVEDVDSSDNETFSYVEVYFDETTNQFTLNEQLYRIPYDTNVYYDENNMSSYSFMAHNNKLYYVVGVDTKERVEASDNPFPRTHGHLVLITMDLEEKSAQHKFLKENYKLDNYNSCFLTGSEHLPMVVRNNKLYVFTSDNEVWIIEDENNIKTLQMPYVFDGNLSTHSLGDRDYIDRKNFKNSNISVEDDGNIYIMNVYPNEVFRIHKLLENSEYELFLEGEMPDLNKDASMLGSFEIINYSNLK
ncbi:hypothetical protein AN642_00885 [Epulopiscium sp. SCG-B10WGA-EpuloA2]|nr:hypothetical protein AN642_00885 [Epulopiscium sp. SCG-B10WGA-EpuloA2]